MSGDIPSQQPNKSVTRGRGATLNMAGRFESRDTAWFDDGWGEDELIERLGKKPKTVIHIETAKSIISRNNSPDIRFDQSVNPYRGCEHGCIYCYARPSHSYLNLSPGIDFETQLFAKTNAAELLRKEISKRGYVVSAINLGANTDPYQPIERTQRITREVIEVLAEANHPLTIVTKNALICRDIDLLAPLAVKKLVQVYVSISQLDNELTRILEPRASSPANRLRAVRELSSAGIPTCVLVAPIIPFINDEFLERVLEAAKDHGAIAASYTVIRLPYEIKALFKDWLATHFPDRAEHVMNRIRDMKQGKENNSDFGERMRGSGIYADLIRQRFRKNCVRLGLTSTNIPALDLTQFAPATPQTGQISLF
ncbi:MAG: PA0069 family radical SAM protein [Betaproteobacteria bacterium]|nr:MAG: PA0069 family radical SAM protein [Betaproteobacteria bacterium]